MSEDAARAKPTAEELVARHQQMPRVDAEALRHETDELFGSDELGSEDDPYTRRRL